MAFFEKKKRIFTSTTVDLSGWLVQYRSVNSSTTVYILYVIRVYLQVTWTLYQVWEKAKVKKTV